MMTPAIVSFGNLSIPKIPSGLEIVAVREIISNSAPSSGSSFFDSLLHSYGPHLSSLFAHPEPDRPRTALAAENLALRQQLAVDNLNAVSGPTERDGAFNEGILSGRTLRIVL